MSIIDSGILNAIKDFTQSHLFPADYCEKYYGGGTDKLSGSQTIRSLLK